MIDTEVRALFSEALDDTPPLSPPVAEDLARGKRLRRRRQRHRFTGLVAVAASAVLALAVLPGDPFPSLESPGIAAEQDELFAADQARILLDDPEWAVWNASLSDDGGNIQYKRGIASLHVGWYEFDDPGTTSLGNYRSQGVPQVPITILDHEAVIFEPAEGIYELVWQKDQVEFGVSGEFDSIDDFRSVIARLYEADDETWLALMSDATRRFDNTEAIAEIAANVPVAETFESRVEGRLDFIDPADEQLLTQEVLHWVACGWVRQRLAGYENQDSSYVDDRLAEVLDFARARDAVTEEPVWDYAEAIVDDEDTVNGRPLYDLFYASQALRCGGW